VCGEGRSSPEEEKYQGERLGRGGASRGPGRREGDGVGCIVIDMALGS
jgi:hypothetical protein